MRLRKPPHFVMDTITRLSYRQLFLLWISITTAFALIYCALSYWPGEGPTGMENMPIEARLFNCLYYSIITATSTGYGDIVPQGLSKVFASIESMVSVLVFAVFVTKLVSHRQEIALREVHKLSFEDIFHNTREELYTVRKDFDRLMEKAEEEKELDDEDWMNLIVAYRQCTTVIQEIPDFYDGVNNLYTIDARREELLQEAVHRTFHRINQLLDILSRHEINWVSHEESISELRELVETTRKISNIWRRKSPYQKEESFERILHLTESIHARMEQALPVKMEKEEDDD